VFTIESLILIHQNIRGLSSKINEFTSMLTLEHTNPQVICFSEQHMTESTLCFPNISNYNLSTGFCCQTYQKGGVYIYVKENISYKSLDFTSYCEEKNFEVCAIQTRSMTNPQIIICMYRSPSGNFYQFLKLFDIMLMSLCQPKTELIICGDINLDYLSDSSKNDNSHNCWTHTTYHTW
jgi:exonuclease III